MADDSVPRKIGWKIFFWVLFLIEATYLISEVVEPTEELQILAVEVVVYFFTFLGIFGYAYNRKFFFQKFWGYFIPVAVLWDVYSLVEVATLEFEIPIEYFIYYGSIAIVVFPLLALQYLALYKYRFHSPYIWNR